MSTVRHRVHTKDDSHEEKKEKVMSADHEVYSHNNNKDQSLSEKIENKTFNEFHDILKEFRETINELNSKTDYLEQKLLTEKIPISSLKSENQNNIRKSHKSNKLPEREFKHTNSLLTELFQIPHIETIRNIFVTSLILLMISTAVSDILETGSTHLGLQTISIAFGQFPNAVLLWLCMKASTIGVYYFFKLWSIQYEINDQKTFLSKFHNFKYILGFIIYILLLIYLPLKIIIDINLPLSSSVAILMEQVRLIMKVYAFVRSNISKVISGKQCPEISQFIYFLFIPTLIYRDNYPRKPTINWSNVMSHFCEVIFVIFYLAFLFERLLLPLFRNFGIEAIDKRTLILRIFAAALPASMVYLCGFYLLLHAWMNAWAEMLRFGDRTFYKDWWNTTSFEVFYRTWNIIIHDWLHTYIYKDLYEYLNGKNKFIPMLTTFMISAIVHEYILAFTFRFFFPVLFISFGIISVIFIFMTRKFARRAGNLFFWSTLSFGNGYIVSAYLIEAYARINCPPYSDDFWDFFVPRCLTTCYK